MHSMYCADRFAGSLVYLGIVYAIVNKFLICGLAAYSTSKLYAIINPNNISPGSITNIPPLQRQTTETHPYADKHYYPTAVTSYLA